MVLYVQDKVHCYLYTWGFPLICIIQITLIWIIVWVLTISHKNISSPLFHRSYLCGFTASSIVSTLPIVSHAQFYSFNTSLLTHLIWNTIIPLLLHYTGKNNCDRDYFGGNTKVFTAFMLALMVSCALHTHFYQWNTLSHDFSLLWMLRTIIGNAFW